jgi:multiple sugar transport system ATP-binding protein
MAGIVLQNVRKVFHGGVVAVDDVSLEVEPGEFLVLVGPSGCGKTTILKMVAGLEPVTAGRIWINGRDVTGLPPRRRDIAMVFQNYALYAHMTVRNNIAFGLKMAKLPKNEIARRVDGAAVMLGLEELLHRKPKDLSGGQRQRVAMGRAIVREPSAFLMDEPLSNLDAKLRVEMRGEIVAVQRRIGAPTLYVTHDQVEAMTMGDRVAILRAGVVEQLGSPDDIYDRPANVFVAGFIGAPAMNLLPARLEVKGDGCVVGFGGCSVPVSRRALASSSELDAYVGRHVVLGIRPEDFQPGGNGSARVDVRVDRVESLGSELVAYIDADPSQSGDLLQRPLLTARLPRGTNVTAGAPVRLAVDPDRLYFFDPQTGIAIR